MIFIAAIAWLCVPILVAWCCRSFGKASRSGDLRWSFWCRVCRLETWLIWDSFDSLHQLKELILNQIRKENSESFPTHKALSVTWNSKPVKKMQKKFDTSSSWRPWDPSRLLSAYRVKLVERFFKDIQISSTRSVARAEIRHLRSEVWIEFLKAWAVTL